MNFKTIFLIFIFLAIGAVVSSAQDLSFGLDINDMGNHPMQNIPKPAYLESIVDPSFGTTIRRITDAGQGNLITPLYSTIQAWNTDETLMIVFDATHNSHLLLDGQNYTFIRTLNDISPDDDEQIFWSHEDPDILFFIDDVTDELIRYHVSTQVKDSIVNLVDAAGAGSYVTAGNDVMMQSWDDDVWGFRTSQDPLNVYSYRVSTDATTHFILGGSVPSENYVAPMPGPSGDTFFHSGNVYNTNGIYAGELNLDNNNEHSCTGKLANGNDAYFAIAFEEGEFGGGQGTIVAHDLTNPAINFSIIGYGNGYPYPQSGTHISATAHTNTEGGWIAASMMGYNQDGQSILDQELVIAKAEQGNIKVCRIGHHRSDEDEFDYYGEPHASISPSGTRVLFASDWSGVEDGQSVDCYVVELPIFNETHSAVGPSSTEFDLKIFPNPFNAMTSISFTLNENSNVAVSIFNTKGHFVKKLVSRSMESGSHTISWDGRNSESQESASGVYFFKFEVNSKVFTKQALLLK